MQKGVAGRGMLGRFLHEGTSQMPVRDATPSHSRVIDILPVAWRGRESLGVENLGSILQRKLPEACMQELREPESTSFFIPPAERFDFLGGDGNGIPHCVCSGA